MAGINVALGLDHHVAHQLLDAGAIDCKIGRLAHPDVGPWRAFDHARLVGPVVRIFVGDDRHAALLETRNGVRRRHLDPVDLARQQRGGARGRLRHGEQDHLVELRHACLVPVVGEARQLHALARYHAIDLERAGTRGLQRHLVPVLALLLPVRGAREENVGHVVGDQRVHHAGRELDGVFVDRLVADQRRDARPHLGELLGIELRRLVVQDLVEVPDHGIGVERRAVMELHTLAQLEDPALGIAFDRRPFGGEAGLDVGDGVGLGEVPVHQSVVDRVAGEAKALETLVRLAGGEGNVGCCHADAQGALRKGRHRGSGN